ncbi:MAG: hypothetical protein HOH66_07235 [Rhodospirillaceae bacterium]|jgi:hypothetical protein|nr:hypothetical protein [Rhodospirillaceae bacterium]MBT6117644.1 hypothetical protein [Rhodospirillaceae bacterium]
MTARILVASHDAGGATALEPVVARLRKRATVEVWAHPLSAPALGGADRITERLGPREASEVVRDFHPDLLLTGTSWGGTTIDKQMTAAARGAGVASLGILDSWIHYRERFTLETDGLGPLLHLPDRLAVMDNEANAEMIALGFPVDRLAVIGLTRLAALPEPGDPAAERAQLADAYGIDPNAVWIHFISQAISALTGGHAGARKALGYSEADARSGITNAVPAIAARLGRATVLILRFHPREDARTAPADAVIDCEDSALAFIRTADAVIGMSGGNLLDAYALARPTISFQPNACGRDGCILSQRGLIERVTLERELPDRLAEALAAPMPHNSSFSRADGLEAAEAAAQLALSMAAKATHAAA